MGNTGSKTALALACEACDVPQRMQLTSTMKESKDWLPQASLIPIDFSPNIGDLVTEKIDDTLTGNDAVSQNAGPSGSICFVVRRPGWVLCREHGQQLTELAASEPEILSNFGMFGVVKETGVVRVFLVGSFAIVDTIRLDFSSIDSTEPKLCFSLQ